MPVDPELLAEIQRRKALGSPMGPNATAPQSGLDKLLSMAGIAAHGAIPVAGGIVGGILGTPAGPAGMIGGSALGGMAGKAYQRVNDYLTGQRDPINDTALGNASDMSWSGLGQAGAALAGTQAEAALTALRPTAAEIGAGGLKALAGVPEKYGEASLNRPSYFKGPDSAQSSSNYQAFENKYNLQGLQAAVREKFGKYTAPSSYFEKRIAGAADDIRDGLPQPVDLQDLYQSGQARAQLERMSKFGDPNAAMAAASSSIARDGKLVDQTIEGIAPGHAKLRDQEFGSNVKEAFGNWLPRNLNGTVSVARINGIGALGAGLGTALAGPVGGAIGAGLGVAATSPMLHQGLIRAGSAMAGPVSAAASFGARSAGEGLAHYLSSDFDKEVGPQRGR